MPNFPFWPEQASSFASRVDLLFAVLVAISGFITLGIVSFILYFVIKYRRGSNADRSNAITSSVPIEVSWMVVLFLLAMGVYVWAAKLYVDMYEPPDEALEIYVVGRQWMWKFQHPDGQREINDLHVPTGQRIKLIMTSQDVIHSLYVPAFRTKHDVMPGRFVTLWFEATKPGEYHLFCTEYCGAEHAEMRGTVTVMEPAEYQAWLEESQSGPSLATSGEQLFVSLGCNSCHQMDGTGRGPSLVGLYGQSVLLESGETVIADDSYIRESILEPREKIVAGYQPIMPTYEGQVNEEEIILLINYIQSLDEGDAETEEGDAQTGGEGGEGDVKEGSEQDNQEGGESGGESGGQSGGDSGSQQQNEGGS